MKNRIEKEILETMIRNPGNWKGPFYFNRKDPRLLVPKQYPWFGWTLNFANTYAYLLIIGLVLIALGLEYFRK